MLKDHGDRHLIYPYVKQIALAKTTVPLIFLIKLKFILLTHVSWAVAGLQAARLGAIRNRPEPVRNINY